MFRNRNRRMTNTIFRVVSRQRPTAVRRRSSRPFLEALEDRLAPATHLWTGGGATALWSNPQNWSGGVPAAGESNLVLHFFNGAQPTNTNDIANLTATEIDFEGTTLYTMGGNTINLLGDTTVFVNVLGTININLGLSLAELFVPPISFHADHIFRVNSSNVLNLNGPISSGPINTLDFQGGGTLKLANGGNTYQGTTLINQGSLTLGANNAVPASSAVQIGLGANLTLNGFDDTIGSLSNAPSGAGNVNLGTTGITTGGSNASTTFTGSFLGSGSLTKVGTGTFTTTAFWDYPGDTTILGGTLVGPGVSSPTNLNATRLTVAAGATWDLGGGARFIGTISGAGTVTHGALTTGQINESTTFSGVMLGMFDLAKTGTGTFTMTAANAYTGPSLEIKNGTLRMGGNNAVHGCDVELNSGATLDLNNFEVSIRNLNSPFGGGSVTLGSGILDVAPPSGVTSTYSGIISGSGAGGFFMEGAGIMVLAGPNTYSGFTLIANGTLRLGAANSVPPGSTVIVDSGAAFDLNNLNDSIAVLQGAGNVTLESGLLTIGGTNANSNFSGSASSTTGAIKKVGSGTMVLSGSFVTFNLSTLVDAGTLLINGNQPNHHVIVESTGTVGGTGAMNQFVAENGTPTVEPGAASPGTFHPGEATFAAGSTFKVRLNGPSDFDRLSVTSALTLASSPTRPTLTVSLNFVAAINDTFPIANASSISGFFSGLPDGTLFTVAAQRFRIHYTATTITLTRVPGPVTHVQIDAVSTSQAGAPFDFTVTALDATESIVSFYGGTVHFSSLDSSATLPDDYTFVPGPEGDNGVHTFSNGATLFRAGTWDVTATDENAGATGSAYVVVTPAPAASFVLDAPAMASSGTPFDIRVTAQDPYGNTDTNYQGTVTFASSDTDPGVVLPADYTFQSSDLGSVTFSGGVTLITPGDQTVTATDTASGISGSATVTVTGGGGSPRGFGNPPFGSAWPALVFRPSEPPSRESVPLPLSSLAVDRLFTRSEMAPQLFAVTHSRHDTGDWGIDRLWSLDWNDDLRVV